MLTSTSELNTTSVNFYLNSAKTVTSIREINTNNANCIRKLTANNFYFYQEIQLKQYLVLSVKLEQRQYLVLL